MSFISLDDLVDEYIMKAEGKPISAGYNSIFTTVWISTTTTYKDIVDEIHKLIPESGNANIVVAHTSTEIIRLSERSLTSFVCPYTYRITLIQG